MTHAYDIIIFGGGIAGLFIANRLHRAGYNLILIEKDKLGGTQTLASQGMIHGGQKYALRGGVTAQAEAVAAMPARWDACFEGRGETDLSGVKFLSAAQAMFPAGSFFSALSVFAAAKVVNGKMQKLPPNGFPQALQRGPVYELKEKVLDTKSLIAVLSANIKGRIFKGTMQQILPDGQSVVDGVTLRAQAVIFAAGTGNEEVLRMLGIEGQQGQRRPLRQIMVKPLPYALYGHGVTASQKPRVTITSHPIEGGYVWYLGGAVAEKGVLMSEEEALHFAKKEMQDIFPAIDWEQKEWASWLIDRAEPFDPAGHLPPGPAIRQCGKTLIVWPTKLTLVPALADNIVQRLKQGGIQPTVETPPPLLPEPVTGSYPWEEAAWQRL